MKKVDTAVSQTVTLTNGSAIIIQELPFMGVLKGLKLIRRIIAKAKELGSIDALIASFRSAEEDGKTSMDRVVAALDMVLGVIGDEPDLLPRLIHLCVVDDGQKWEVEDLGNLPMSDVIDLAKAVYEVNWVKGSLKKALGKVGLKIEEKDSTALPTPPSQPSPMPAAEKTSTTGEASTS